MSLAQITGEDTFHFGLFHIKSVQPLLFSGRSQYYS